MLFFLWLPGIKYPIVSDTAIYALLGESVWTTGRYLLLGVPYAKHLPLHAIVSFPLAAFFGYGLGMKVSTLLAAWAVLILTYRLLRPSFGRGVALLSVVTLTFHHGFVLTTMLGSADLLFAAFFLASVLFYRHAEDDPRGYLGAGVCAGLASLTRYNGLPLFGLYCAWTAWKRRAHLRSSALWSGMILGGGIVSLWFVRNFLVFGNVFQSEYVGELAKESDGPFSQVISNLFFYGNPLHNILPILFVCALYGLWTHGRRQQFLVAVMLTAWLLTAIWWVQAMRFALVGYVILIGFGVRGLVDLWESVRWRRWIVVGSVFFLILSHGFLLCFYAYGECNALIDRSQTILPKNIGVSSEGFYTWHQAREFINASAPPGATVFAGDPVNALVWQKGVFRPDLRVIGEDDTSVCPLYRITQRLEPVSGETVVFRTGDVPVTAVMMRSDCEM